MFVLVRMRNRTDTQLQWSVLSVKKGQMRYKYDI